MRVHQRACSALTAWVRGGEGEQPGDLDWYRQIGSELHATAAMWLLHRGAEIDTAYPRKWQWVEAFRTVLEATAQPGVDWPARQYPKAFWMRRRF